MKDIEICPSCNTSIEDGECDCGTWHKKGQLPYLPAAMGNAIDAYNHQFEGKKKEIITGSHFTGTAIIIFEGDEEKCDAIRAFLLRLE
jgi:hypothetical protein